MSVVTGLAGQIAASPNSASPISSHQRGQRGGVPGPKGIAKEAAKALAQGNDSRRLDLPAALSALSVVLVIALTQTALVSVHAVHFSYKR